MDKDEFRKIRKAARLTQAQMATRLGYSRQAIIHWEAGVYQIPDAVLDKLVDRSLAPGSQPVKELEGEPYYKVLNRSKGHAIRQLAHPFWHLAVVSPFRNLLTEEQEIALRGVKYTTAHLEGYTAPTPEEAFHQLVANKCTPQSAWRFVVDDMGYMLPERLRPIAAINPEMAQYNKDKAEFEANYPGAGWRLFEELYPQHRAPQPAQPVFPEPTIEEGRDLENGLARYLARINSQTAKD